MSTSVNSKAIQVPAMVRESDGALLIWTSGGYRTPEEAGVTIDTSSGGSTGGTGGTGGAITLSDGADATIGSKSDPVATDPTAPNTSMSLTKAQTAAMLEFVKAIGAKAGGAAGAASLLTGGMYSATAPTLANGQQASFQFGLRNSAKFQLMSADGTAGAEVTGGNADGVTGANGKLAAAAYGMVWNGTNYDRMRGNTKGMYVVPATPDTLAGSDTAKTVSGTSEATATLLATIPNPGLRYKRVAIWVGNQSSNAFAGFIIKTRVNPARAYDTTFKNDFIPPRGYLAEVSVDPATLTSSSGECRIVMDCSIFDSIQILAYVGSGSPSASGIADWYFMDV